MLSVFDSFYNAAEKGRFPDLADRDELWQLLLRMSARKVIDTRRHDQRQRRGGDVKVHSLNQTGEDDRLIEAIGDEPSPEMALMMAESVDELFSHLANESQQYSLTATHQIMGTPRYMAPEQLEGTHNVATSGLVILTGLLQIGN